MEEVYRLSELDNPARLKALFQAVAGIEEGSLVAVKLHMGELINYRFIRPVFVREIVAAIKEVGGKPFLTDSTTLYPRGRYDAIDYLETARQNGFNFSTVGAPVIIADGLRGKSGVIVETGGKLVEQIEIGQAIYEADYLVTLTHCTGHISTGYGGALKNLGMGCTTKNGKRAVHRFSVPEVDEAKCERCETCINVCPYSVISMGEFPELNSLECVGCSRCVRACPTGAMHNPAGWFEDYITALVEAANAVIKKFGDNLSFINFLTDITAMCDCTFQQEPLVPDLGALASRDILSIEQASYDLIKESAGRDVLHESTGIDGELQFKIAEELGIGSRRYKLINLE
ncbi:MAG: DUF362 domain-containing protein [Candidatus Methanospirareceae archaeon]